MRVAALYDIHGNLPALDAVLAEVQIIDPEVIVIGGDVGGPLIVETLDRLLALGSRARFVRGNHDRELVDAFDAGASPEQTSNPLEQGTYWAARRLNPPLSRLPCEL